MKIKLILTAAMLTAVCYSCGTSKQPEIKGTVHLNPDYGTLECSFLPGDLNNIGIEAGDLVTVEVGNMPAFQVPFVTVYTQAGIMSPSICDYGNDGDLLDLGVANGSFYARVGGNDGDSIKITLFKKGGYLKEYDLLKGDYTFDPKDYASAEVFANFRNVTEGNIVPGRLYRSSNPLNPKSNKVRYAVADSLAALAGIKCEVDIADTPAKIEKYLASDGFKSTYCPALYREGNVIALGMTADFFLEESMQKVADGIRFMISHKGPYLLHCNEGKDRCGFMCALIEAICGASLEEIRDDYMETFENYYWFQKGSDSWLLNRTICIDRMIWLQQHPEDLKDIMNVDWSKVSVEDINPYDAAKKYLTSAGLTEAEIQNLVEILTDPAK